MTDPYVEKIIEENEERAREHEGDNGDTGLAKEVDGFFAPVIDAIDNVDGADHERSELDAVENDKAQRPE